MTITDITNEERAMAQLTEIFALECGVNPAIAKRIRAAASLHDIGKLKIPECILNKRGKLTEREFGIMKTHTILGAEMLDGMQGDTGDMAKKIALYHHENYAGTGYWKKFSDELPQYVHIATIADVFIALLSKRPYKERWPPEDAMAYISGGAGTLFNPAMAKTFVSLAGDGSRIKEIFK